MSLPTIKDISDNLSMKDAKKQIPTFVEQRLQAVPGLGYCVTREYFVYYDEETAKQKLIESNKSFDGLENIRRLNEEELTFFNKDVVVSEHITYLSDRNKPLLWNSTCDVPIITAENYEKWYSLFVVYPDGKVEKVPVEVLQEVLEKTKKCLWIDHYFHPKLIESVAEHYKGEAHQLVLEVAAGRWVFNDLPTRDLFN